MQRLQVAVGQHSRAGRHAVNQDFHGAVLPPEPQRSTKGIVLALADGVGSSAVSQVASAAAVHGFLQDYYLTSEAWTVRRSAQCVLGATNSWLHAQTMRSDARFDRERGFVCTFSALVFKGREAHLLHVGDSRIFRLHPQALEQLTQDHLVQVSGARACLGRALGASARVEIDHRSWLVETGEVYLLATDGAYRHLDAAIVHQALARHGDDLDAAAAALTAAALERGGDDDATLQLACVQALPDAEAHRLHEQRAGLLQPPPLSPGLNFEGYTIVRELHISARSHVHLAVDTASGEQVVLKTPSEALREDPASLDRFLLDEWVARRIDSVHVLKPRPNDRPRRHLFVAMAFVEGTTLAQWMTDHPRPDLDTVRGIVDQVARGLQAFHHKEMLHQDLRPENLMIDRTGTVKIIDFGSVYVAGLAEGTGDARPRDVAGTLQYTAPEYFTGAGGSARSDLFSLAVLTYQMLTGRLPYGLQVTQLRTPADLKRLRLIPVRQYRPDLPAWLDAVLRKALHTDPARRQEAVSELVHDLRSPGPSFQRDRPPPLVERHPVVFWQATTALLAAAVLVLVALRTWGG